MQGDRAVIGGRPLMTLEPLLRALRDTRYVFIQDLRIWNVIMPYEMVASVVCVLDDRVKVQKFITCHVIL